MRVATKGLTNTETSVFQCLLYPFEVDFAGEPDSPDLLVSTEDHSSIPTIRLRREESRPVAPFLKDNIVEFPYDLIRLTCDKLHAVMNPPTASSYLFFTRWPIAYNLIPSWIRASLLRTRAISADGWDLAQHLAFEVARKTLRRAFSLLGFSLERRTAPSLVITHDIDTRKGLRRAESLKRTEEKLGLRSIWFLTSHEYPISRELASNIGQNSTIGSHDVRHDGKLISISDRRDLVTRLMASKAKLEVIFEKHVESFRSPLLQFNKYIAQALNESGYKYDYSVPTWEPVHPSTMRGSGIESVSKFPLNGIVETPLSLFQDHQLLSVLNLNTHEAVKLWIRQASLIRHYDGDIVLLVHPDYAFGNDPESYEELLLHLTQDRSHS